MTSYDPGAFCWADLGTPQPARAAAFYGSLLGWSVGEPDPDGYRLVRLDGRLVAALGPASDGGEPFWTAYVSVADLAVTIGLTVGAGGCLVEPASDAATLGRSAVIRDSQGSLLSLWQPGLHAGAEVTHEPGSWSRPELVTGDPAAAAAFYRRVLGWEVGPADGPGPRLCTLHDRPVATLRTTPTGWPSTRATLWTVPFTVTDLPGAVQHARALGGGRAVDLPGISQTVVLPDDQGALVTLRAARPRR